MLSAIASAIIINPTIGVFVKPMVDEFGWNRSIIAGAVAIGTLTGGLVALGVGPIIDRFGARWVLIIGFLIMGGLFIAWSGVTTLWQFYGVIIISRMLLQGSHQPDQSDGASQVVCATPWASAGLRQPGSAVWAGRGPVANTDDHQRRGLAMGRVIAGHPRLESDAHPGAVVDEASAGRHGPAPRRGRTRSAGGQPGARTRRGAAPGPEVHFTLREALRTRTLYILLAVLCLTSFVNTGVNFNLIPYLSDQGLSANQAVALLMLWSLVGIPAALSAGLLIERLPTQAVLAGFQLGMIAGTLLLLALDSVWIGVVFALVHGIAFAGSLLAQQIILADYYGSRHLGALRGAVLPWQMASNAVGPLAATLVFDTQGSYVVILWLYVVIQSLVFFALLAARKPRHHSMPEVEGG